VNYRGSFRRLFGNAMSAMLGAIEIYNKPRFPYRDEVFTILLINAWELLLKAIISKNRQSIYYRKKRGEPYRTLSCRDAFWCAANSKLWPRGVELRAVEANIDLLVTYRDNAVHFYNDPSFGSLIYSLAQTSVLNFRDVASSVFGKDIAKEITWRIMPLGITNPIDPIEFMKGATGDRGQGRSRAVQDFLAYLKEKVDALDADGIDTGRLLTVFDVSLQSIKKVSNADIVVGVSSEELAEAIVVSRRVDPNVSHPYRQKELLPRLKRPMTSHGFQAIVYAHSLRDDPKYFWADKAGSVVRWSPDVAKFIDSLSEAEIEEAIAKYAARFSRSSR
jgi:hypothetical protein